MFRRRLHEIIKTVERIAAGDRSTRVSLAWRSSWGRLAVAINHMVDRLQEQQQDSLAEKERFRIILDSMAEGVLVTNQKGEITLTNPTLHELLEIPTEYRGRKVLECLRHKELHETIEKVLSSGDAQSLDFTVFVESSQRSLTVQSSPLRDGDHTIVGTVSVFYDLTEIRKLESMRREFVANVSHELKTPLTSIQGYAETLLTSALNDSQTARRFTEKIERNAKQLKNLIEDLLKISEIESGRRELHLTKVRVSEMIASLWPDHEERALAKGMHLVNQIPPGLTVLADSASLKQILNNLLDNAIKYTNTAGVVTLKSETAGSTCRLMVQDTGIGIPDADLPHVFERFYRVDKARSRELGGTGLGLAITKHLVQAQGGNVAVKSTVGQGSEFSFTLQQV